jgi:hypothetical protein
MAEKHQRYEQTEKAKARRARYEKTDKAKARQARYAGTAKGYLRTYKQNLKRRKESLEHPDGTA